MTAAADAVWRARDRVHTEAAENAEDLRSQMDLEFLHQQIQNPQ